MVQDIATVKTMIKKEMVFTDEAIRALNEAFLILDNISDEWNSYYPEFKEVREALKNILEMEKFEMVIDEERD